MKRFAFLFLTCCCFLTMSAQDSLVSKTSLEALEAATAAFAQRSYNLADYYADQALKDSATAKKAAEIKIQCMEKLRKTEQDSTRYIVALLELHDHDRPNPVFNKLLMEYFTAPGREKDLRQYVHDEIRKDPSNKWNWALDGEIHMREAKWDKAIASFKHAVSLDSTFVEAIYNIGVCHVSKAVALHDSLNNENKNLSQSMQESIKAVYKLALAYLEKARELDPKQETVGWANLLFQIYTLLDDKRAKEIEELRR